MSAGWPFSTGLSGRPVSSTRIWVLWNQHCAFPATFFATTALLWKKRQNSFKMIQANPGNPSWYWSEVMVHKERERAQAWWEENGTKLEVDDWFMANIASISCWNNVEICWNTKRGPHHQSHQMLRDGAQELARLGAGADWQMWNSMVVAWKSFDVVWWNWWTVPLKIHEVWVLMIFDEIWCDG